MESLLRIRAIARNTLIEALRQKVLNILLLFGVITIVSGFLFANFTLAEQFKFLKDFSIGAMSVFGLLIALMGTAQLLPGELESRTIYTILAKPVRRSEFLIGKYLGILALLATTILLMSIVFVGVLLVKEQSMIASEWRDAGPTPTAEIQAMAAENVKQIHKEARDPRLVQAVLLTYAKLSLVAGMALLVSTFATSAIFTVATTFLLYVIGHLESIARQAWLQGGTEVNPVSKVFLGVLSFLIPDMNTFNVIDEIIAGNAIPWSHSLNVLAYTGIYIFVVMAVSILIFNEREL
jgi:ABC-type Na+ efflux pump permease subunit